VAVIIILDDGRSFEGSTLEIGGVLSLIADELTEDQLTLKKWLLDMSERVSFFADFDMRGFVEPDRDAFWQAAERALSHIFEKRGPLALDASNAYAANCLNRMLKEKAGILAGEPPSKGMVVSSFDGEMIDLKELWCDE
jgi:hypothetical protein